MPEPTVVKEIREAHEKLKRDAKHGHHPQDSLDNVALAISNLALAVLYASGKPLYIPEED